MIWPGMGDPYKRKKTIKFLIITAIIGISVAAASTAIQQLVNTDNPLKVCINDRHTPYKISATLDLYVDGHKAEIPANAGFKDGCQRTMYTLSNDGVIYRLYRRPVRVRQGKNRSRRAWPPRRNAGVCHEHPTRRFQ